MAVKTMQRFTLLTLRWGWLKSLMLMLFSVVDLTELEQSYNLHFTPTFSQDQLKPRSVSNKSSQITPESIKFRYKHAGWIRRKLQGQTFDIWPITTNANNKICILCQNGITSVNQNNESMRHKFPPYQRRRDTQFIPH